MREGKQERRKKAEENFKVPSKSERDRERKREKHFKT